jgi:Bacteriophage lambda head decoration protein D
MTTENVTKRESLVRDNLIAGQGEVTGKSITLLGGENTGRGSVLGKITLGAVSETHAGNTGTGAMTLDATTPKLANAQVGVYKAVCITAVENGGVFRVSDPMGNVLGDVAVGATFASQIKFSIADATDFIVGDTFLITVAKGSEKYKLATSAAVDGSQYPDAVLAKDTDATGGDTTTGVYIAGEFNENALILGTGHTLDTVRESLRAKGIQLLPSVPA